MTPAQRVDRMKTCTKCGEAKPVAAFHTHARGRDGLRTNCKACTNASAAAWYAANREKAKANNIAWCAANPEKCRAKSAAWAAANPEKVKKRHAAWLAANPEKVRAHASKWAKANPEARRIHGHNRRARKRANGGRLSPGLAAKLFKLQKGKCACCHVSIADGNHLDHRIPVALGGPNEDWNMQLLCGPCNMSKGAKHPVDFMQQRGFLL